jgi:hypothetical protein
MESTARSTSAARAAEPFDTPEMHNASIDEDAARDGACAQLHLPTGRMCTLVAGHSASCDFVAADQADAALAQHKADEGW